MEESPARTTDVSANENGRNRDTKYDGSRREGVVRVTGQCRSSVQWSGFMGRREARMGYNEHTREM